MASSDTRNTAIVRFPDDIALHLALNTSPSPIIASSGTIAEVDTVAVDPIHTLLPTIVSDRITEFV